MTTEERLEKMEQELAQAKRLVRRFVIAALACVGVLVVGWAGVLQTTAQEKAQVLPEVRARNFVLVDENGKMRAGLTVLKYGPGLNLIDENGKIRAQLGVGMNGPGLFLLDENGKGRTQLIAGMNGPELFLLDENGKTRAGLIVLKAGPRLDFHDENGKAIFKAP